VLSTLGHLTQSIKSASPTSQHSSRSSQSQRNLRPWKKRGPASSPRLLDR
jgi:hypothetical protein